MNKHFKFKLSKLFSLLENILFLRKGSVIADLMIDYNFINREQLVQIVDAMEETKMFGTVALGYFSVNSTKSTHLIYYITYYTDAYSELSQTSKMVFFAKMVNDCKPLTIFALSFILDGWKGSEYGSVTTGISYCYMTIKSEEN